MVLYSFNFGFHFGFLGIIIFLIALIAAFKLQKNVVSKVFCGSVLTVVFVITTVVIYFKGGEFIYIYNKYKSENYVIVEGKVENFSPMPIDGHAYETFTVNGVEFKYSDYYEVFGYNKTFYHGGVIRKNGQKLKIGYVVFNGENRIVYIEQL